MSVLNSKQHVKIRERNKQLCVPCRIDECIVCRTEVLPCTIGNVLARYVRNILSENDSETQIQVPVDMTVEEPWARVIGEEPNRYDIRMASASAHDIANDRVVKVVGRIPSATDHVERVPVQVNRVRSTDSQGRDGKLHTLVRLEAINTARGEEIRRILRATQDLEQHRDGRRIEGDAVDGEIPGVESKRQIDIDISAARGSIARHTGGRKRVKIGLDKGR